MAPRDEEDRAPRGGVPELAEALSTGPFEDALRVAIEVSGLTLARLEYHLEQRGLHIGRSTISYWQQGRRRPERKGSLEAVTALEEILGLPRDSLSQLLGPPRPRGRWIGHVPGSLEWADLFDFADNVEAIIVAESRKQNNRLRETFSMDQLQMGIDRRKVWQDTRKVVRAREDGADRQLAIFYEAPEIDVSRVYVSDLENCRVGRQRAVVARNFVAVEFLFDRVLTANESHLLSYRVNYDDAYIDEAPDKIDPDDLESMRGFRYPLAAFTLQARFHPQMLPVRCYAVSENRNQVPESVRELTLTAQSTCHLAIEDVQPGFHGLRWEWE